MGKESGTATAEAAPAPAAQPGGGAFDHADNGEKAPWEQEPPAPSAQPAPSDEQPPAEGGAQATATEEPGTTEGEPDSGAEKPQPEAAATTTAEPAPAPKMWAGQFKTPEDLEIAYGHSSQEGKRLAGVVKEIQASSEKEIGSLRDRIAELEIQAEVGPEIKDPTDEDLEKMGPVAATRLLNKIEDRKRRLADLKARREQGEKDAKAKAAALGENIRKMSLDMQVATDDKGELLFPGYRELIPEMDDLMAFEPGVSGHPNSPIILYLAAKGRQALKLESASKIKTKESQEAAKAKAKAASAGAGAAGAPGGTDKPKSAAGQPKPGSDEDHNNRLVAAGKRRREPGFFS